VAASSTFDIFSPAFHSSFSSFPSPPPPPPPRLKKGESRPPQDELFFRKCGTIKTANVEEKSGGEKYRVSLNDFSSPAEESVRGGRRKK
jgi:hypothetical protein